DQKDETIGQSGSASLPRVRQRVAPKVAEKLYRFPGVAQAFPRHRKILIPACVLVAHKHPVNAHKQGQRKDDRRVQMDYPHRSHDEVISGRPADGYEWISYVEARR